jgi:hypothetical protein
VRCALLKVLVLRIFGHQPREYAIGPAEPDLKRIFTAAAARLGGSFTDLDRSETAAKVDVGAKQSKAMAIRVWLLRVLQRILNGIESPCVPGWGL